jgi:hypothetical protein
MTKHSAIKTAVALGAMVIGQFAATAGLTVTALVGGAPIAGSSQYNFNLPLGTTGGSVAGSLPHTGNINVSFDNTGAVDPNKARVVQGSSSGVYAAPWISGSSDVGFGNQVVGAGGAADTTPYLTTGKVPAYVILDLTGKHNYIGLLWGSIDTYNVLEFYNNGSLVYRLSNNPLDGTKTEFDKITFGVPSSNQQLNGSKYVNIQTTQWFDEIRATSDQIAFEFTNVALVPEPSTYIAGGLALLPLLLGLRARWNKKA